MRKSAVICAGLIIIFSLTACGENNTESSEKYSKNDILGEWYSGEIGGSFYFGDDNNLSLIVDMTDAMHIDENNIIHLAGMDEDYSDSCNFDGKTYNFSIDEAEILTMSRDESDESAFGEYTLTGGIIYNELAETYGELEDRYSVIVDKDVFEAKIRMCEYSVNSNVVTFSGDDLSVFGGEEGTVSIFNFAVENNVLTLVSENNTLVFSKVE